MDSRPKSSTLFHFTGEKEFLLSILRQGYQPRYCLEYFPWFGSRYFASFAMTCFCEIPLSRIGLHISRYGKYGLGMSREWAVSQFLSPVAYCPSGNSRSSEAIDLLLRTIEKPGNNQRDDLMRAAFNLLRYYKPMNGPQIKRLDDGKVEMEERIDFSEECEWRHMPVNENNILGKSIRSESEQWNASDVADLDQEVKQRNEMNQAEHLIFSASDIKYIFVPSEDDVDQMHCEIMKSNSLFPERSDKINLTTKITPLDRLSLDL